MNSKAIQVKAIKRLIQDRNKPPTHMSIFIQADPEAGKTFYGNTPFGEDIEVTVPDKSTGCRLVELLSVPLVRLTPGERKELYKILTDAGVL